MITVFYSAQIIHKSSGTQVAQMSGAMQTVLTGMALHEQAANEATDWYRYNGRYPLDAVNVHLVALNYI
jgi:hypothetical protein|uniref:Uncharacterized protein n=1 Tax=Caudovirales sp. ctTqA28 TaxID=2826775 RepID=A0A8S5MDC7_9CAUD|nr:MAG TPA: hypothetical protein [Caudovirales sp. ctTqA28]